MSEHLFGTEKSCPSASPMRTGLFKFGLAATLLWLLAGAGLMLLGSDRSNLLKPNEWGDVFAGIFAPVAFLWLVLGFLQQGKELQLSTQALELQVKELKNSVEQQAALVDVSRQQVQATLDDQERRLAEAEASKQPIFIIKPVRSVKLIGDVQFELEIQNDGASITELTITPTPASTVGDSDFHQHLEHGETVSFFYICAAFPPEGLLLDFSYFDSILKARRMRFQVLLPSDRRSFSSAYARRLPPDTP